LLLTGETYSKYIHPDDKGNKTLFGDAGTATLVSNKIMNGMMNLEIGEFCYGTDGSDYDKLIVRNGSSRHKIQNGKTSMDSEGRFIGNDNNLYMDGKAIFNFTAFKIPSLIEKVLKKNDLKLTNIDYYIFHQANEFMLNTVRKRCNIPEDKFCIDIKDVGNTVSNTLPIALTRAYSSGRINSCKNILLSGFGVGLSMGAVIIYNKNI
jgi:3-oxoacyl-[acyl-carrier-protein] synthase-3